MKPYLFAMHSDETRIASVKLFYENGSSFVRARRTCRVTFGMYLQSDRKTLRRWITTFESIGSLSNIEPPCRNHSIRNIINIDRVSRSLHEDDIVSTRKCSIQLNISRSSLRGIVKKYLKLLRK